MNGVNRKWYSGMSTQEDWWAVWLGLFMFAMGLLSIWGIDAVGWQYKPSSWAFDSEKHTWLKAFKPSSKVSGSMWKELGMFGTLTVSWIVWTVVTSVGAFFMKLDVKRFAMGFTILFWITALAIFIGREAHLSVIAPDFKKYGIEWGLSLGGGVAYITALIVGLIIGNFIKPLAAFMKEACKPEWYIKTAIVYLGIKVGVMSMQAAGYTFDIAIAGACATFVAYLLFWPIIYWIGRTWFKLPRQWAAVLCSGISVCGVSAAIATAGAIRAKPIIPTMVSMLIIVYAMVELIFLPSFYTFVAPHEPIVNGAAMGMTVKTDGADAAAGALLDEMMRALPHGANWAEDSILTAAIMTKIWIDMFIGLWAFILALVWVYKVERAPGTSHVPFSEVWFRFPKFVLGYIFCWFFYIALMSVAPDIAKLAKHGADVVQSPMRKMLFLICFVAMGCVTDFSKMKGMGRLAGLYAVALTFVIAPIAYFVAWIFHHGMVPPPAG